jgi:hypothetical protein
VLKTSNLGFPLVNMAQNQEKKVAKTNAKHHCCASLRASNLDTGVVIFRLSSADALVHSTVFFSWVYALLFSLGFHAVSCALLDKAPSLQQAPKLRTFGFCSRRRTARSAARRGSFSLGKRLLRACFYRRLCCTASTAS